MIAIFLTNLKGLSVERKAFFVLSRTGLVKIDGGEMVPFSHQMFLTLD